jgi:UDP-N-acetylmuramoylalanine--D-glutamate ligase
MKRSGTRAAVLGLGSSGEAAARLLQMQGAEVTVFDSGDPDPAKIDSLRQRGITTVVGPAANQARAGYDVTILSPGIDPAVPLVQNFRGQGASFTAEIELAFQSCSRPVIAITGTNGKTTTTQLIEAMLNSAGIRALACGNIGMPFSDAVQAQDGFDVFAVEVSSFQLETISTFRPKIAVWLNIAPDHLDRYSSFEEYRQAKLRIFENQQPDDFAVVNWYGDLPNLAAQTISFSAAERQLLGLDRQTPTAKRRLPNADLTLSANTVLFRGEPVLNLSETHLAGIHQAENLMASLGTAFALKIPWREARKGLCEYRALPHRCEPVGEIDGVRYINDSKATNVDALARALASQIAPIVLIAGGKNKGLKFDAITDLVRSKVKYAVLIGEIARDLLQEWSAHVPCSVSKTLPDAVAAAQRVAQPGDVVLLSPGTSSFDLFKDYADRGDQFREIVKELNK